MTDKRLTESHNLLGWTQVVKYIDAAQQAFEPYRSSPVLRRIEFLRQISKEIAVIRAELVDVSHKETHLPHGRLNGEIDRTLNQINLFVQQLEDGTWVNAIIDVGDSQRTPMPKPDIRQMQVPLGPVCVYGASNFPFAFSVAGGDTISALAAGCPVIYKIHMGHPKTSLLVSNCIERAMRKMDIQEGVFAALMIASREVGTQMVTHPSIKAVAFTGSYAGGKALYDAAVRRRDPIPVYAEMGSINPVFILPDQLTRHAEATASALVASNTVGAGQFCTNPGLLIMVDSPGATQFLGAYGELLGQQMSQTMLTPGMHSAYVAGVNDLKATTRINVLAEGKDGGLIDAATPVAFRVSGSDFLLNEKLKEEYFGPASIHVIAAHTAQLLEIAQSLDGQLTTSIWGTDADIDTHGPLFSTLEHKAGRLIINGAPTGVEVCHAMVHGGPFPATTDAKSTSVGSQAIYRFTRPVCYQSYPDRLLPAELRNDNVSSIWRKVDGELTQKSI